MHAVHYAIVRNLCKIEFFCT